MLGVGQLGLWVVEEYFFFFFGEAANEFWGDFWVSAFSPATR